MANPPVYELVDSSGTVVGELNQEVANNLLRISNEQTNTEIQVKNGEVDYQSNDINNVDSVDATSITTDDSVTVKTGEATNTLHYGSNQDRSNAGNESVAIGIGARAPENKVVAVGFQAVKNNTGLRVTAAGYQAVKNNTGLRVTAAGYLAGLDNTGDRVTAAGYEVARNNTGGEVTAAGFNSARSNTGDRITAVGNEAAQNNTGNDVMAAGYQAAQDNTGDKVTVVGYQAAKNNTGSRVTATGFRAAENNTGLRVTAAGLQAAKNNTGSRVTVTGLQAARSNTGSRVTATGFRAARGDGLTNPSTMGDDNIGIGTSAIRNNQASGLIAIGQEAGINAQTDDQLIITDQNGDRRMEMDLTNGDLSIEGSLTQNASL